MTPAWLHILSLFSIVLGVACALWVTVDVVRRPPHMTVMTFVGPLTALFGSLLLVAFYLRHGPAHSLLPNATESTPATATTHRSPSPWPRVRCIAAPAVRWVTSSRKRLPSRILRS